MRALPLVFLLGACAGDATMMATGDTGAPDTDTDQPADLEGYAFASRFDNADSVAYSGQVFRQLLIEAMKARLGGLTDRLNNGLFPTEGQIAGELNFYFEFDSATSGSLEHGVSTDPAPLQTTFEEVSSDKDLVGKIAGNDSVTDHVDWSTAFVGWGQEGVTSPESLVTIWINEVDAAAVGWSQPPLGPDGQPVPAVFVTSDGRDLQQLLEKFLRGAIAFSQGVDDYLDDDVEGKGLLADHTEAVEGANYTALEHAWDEGFGYFGAARTYGDWTDDEIADGEVDADEDGAIDLLTEVSWGHSGNAGKRDLGAVVATDFTQEAWDGFVNGRTLLAEADGALTTEQTNELTGYRDQAVEAWEKAIAATVVHYINDTIQDMDAIGTDDYDFGDHAKHWSEMKGFALAFQFNPRSPLSDQQFANLHDFMGTAPVLGTATPNEQGAYRAGLLAARALLGEAYGFDAANLGDENGLNGW